VIPATPSSTTFRAVEHCLRFYHDTLTLEVISPPGAPAAFRCIGAPTGGIAQQIVLVPRPAADRTTSAGVHAWRPRGRLPALQQLIA
jgi:hypothetical protein